MRQNTTIRHYYTPDGISFELERKRVRNVNLRVRQDGSVYVSAPRRVSLAAIEQFVSSKRSWILARQQRSQERIEALPSRWRDGETICVWGVPHDIALIIDDHARGGSVACRGGRMLITVNTSHADDGDASCAYRSRLVDRFLKEELRTAAEPLLREYERHIGVHATSIRYRRMKTRWGSCNVRSGAITLNIELAERPHRCLESVVVHELCHLLEPSHNAHFHALMDQHYPTWREARKALNELPPRR